VAERRRSETRPAPIQPGPHLSIQLAALQTVDALRDVDAYLAELAQAAEEAAPRDA